MAMRILGRAQPARRQGSNSLHLGVKKNSIKDDLADPRPSTRCRASGGKEFESMGDRGVAARGSTYRLTLRSKADEIHEPAKCVHRMLSKSGNPTMPNVSFVQVLNKSLDWVSIIQIITTVRCQRYPHHVLVRSDTAGR